MTLLSAIREQIAQFRGTEAHRPSLLPIRTPTRKNSSPYCNKDGLQNCIARRVSLNMLSVASFGVQLPVTTTEGNAVIDTTTEKPIPLAQAAHLIPPARRGKKTHLSTLLRWILRGARGPSGEIVRLDAIRIGGRWMTSREVLQRFAEALTPRLDAPPPPTPRTPTARARASEKAARELEKMGI